MPTLRTIRPLLGTLALLASAQSWALAPDELFRQVSPSVWQVGTLDDQGKPIATGSAVVIAPQTLVTNCHVLKGAARVVVRQHATTHAARLLHADTERDLCQLTAASLQAPAVRVAPEPAHIGQRIYTIGAPRGLELTLSDGLVSGLREAGADGGLIQISAPISPGSSGGGLFDEEGRLLGITSMGIVGVAQNLNFARPASLIAGIPARATAALQKWRDGKATVAAPPAVIQVTAAPPPAPAQVPTPVASGFAPLLDVDAIPYIGDRGRAQYRWWLGLAKPRAFAISRTGEFAAVHGTRPDYVAPSDPSERALQACEQRAKAPCKLYAVDDVVVYVGDAVTQPPVAAARPAPSPPPAPPAPRAGHIASGYAALDDIDAIPYLSERGRRDYQSWLQLPLPRAFAIAPNGYHWHTSTTHPKELDLPVDPSERALLMCERGARRPCKLYAVNNAVVWVKEPSPLARDLFPGTQTAAPTTPP